MSRKSLLHQDENDDEPRFYNKLTGNDRWAVDVFNGMRKGFFVEAGAADGIRSSCTYTLERYFDWTGILVEPTEAGFRELGANRPNSNCENKCLDSTSHEVVVFTECERMWRSGIKQHINPKKLEDFSSFERNVETISLLDLLRKFNAPKIIHYCALDTEGSEYNILKTFDFNCYRILAFSIEGSSCNDLLQQNSYKQVHNPHSSVRYENYFLHRDFDKYIDLSRR